MLASSEVRSNKKNKRPCNTLYGFIKCATVSENGKALMSNDSHKQNVKTPNQKDTCKPRTLNFSISSSNCSRKKKKRSSYWQNFSVIP